MSTFLLLSVKLAVDVGDEAAHVDAGLAAMVAIGG